MPPHTSSRCATVERADRRTPFATSWPSNELLISRSVHVVGVLWRNSLVQKVRVYKIRNRGACPHRSVRTPHVRVYTYPRLSPPATARSVSRAFRVDEARNTRALPNMALQCLQIRHACCDPSVSFNSHQQPSFDQRRRPDEQRRFESTNFKFNKSEPRWRRPSQLVSTGFVFS